MMFVSFEDVFNAEKQEMLANKIHERAIKEHWCCTCRHCKCEHDGDWCEFRNTVADGPCLFYELEPSHWTIYITEGGNDK